MTCISSNSSHILLVGHHFTVWFSRTSFFFPKDNSQFIVQFAEQVTVNYPSKNLASGRKAQVELLPTLLTQATRSSLWDNVTVMPAPSAFSRHCCLWLSAFLVSVCSVFIQQACWELLATPHYVIDCVTCHLPAQLFCIWLLMFSVHGEAFVTLWLSEMGVVHVVKSVGPSPILSLVGNLPPCAKFDQTLHTGPILHSALCANIPDGGATATIWSLKRWFKTNQLYMLCKG